jgi:hypothetical protein
MENMDKGLTVPKWELINWLKIPQMPHNLSAQFFCPSPKVWDFDEKRLHQAFVVHDHDKLVCTSIFRELGGLIFCMAKIFID